MKKRIYLSGRMSGLPSQEWYSRFTQAAWRLCRHGHQVVNPADILVARKPWLYRALEWIVGGGTAYRVTLAYDLWLLKHCTHIYMVGNDWQQSRGARLERMKAREWGISELKP